ncbi:MAG: BrnT family toxin [Terracidiphilus sp.]
MGSGDPLAACTGFDWDEANVAKNWDRHRVTPQEAEDVFFRDPFVLRSDPAHSIREKRYWALGRTASDRMLFVAFTIRGKLIRIVSARDMNRREIEAYRRHEKSDS